MTYHLLSLSCELLYTPSILSVVRKLVDSWHRLASTDLMLLNQYHEMHPAGKIDARSIGGVLIDLQVAWLNLECTGKMCQ